MEIGAIRRQRVINQQIGLPAFAQPSDVVHWFGAMQAQDYLAALWAVGLRTPGATEQAVEEALAQGAIVRTWPMRGTIHFVAAADVRWMLELLTPRVIERSKGRMKQLGLDTQTIAASSDVVVKALQGGRQLSRPALYAVLEEANISTSGQRGLHILGRLAHERLICFGPRAGKQPTFTLLDEWVPASPALSRHESLATLAARYFTSHGPATIQDFMWWSGLTATDATAALNMADAQLTHVLIEGQRYYRSRHEHETAEASHEAYLLPPFDEFLVAYRDRSASLDPQYNSLIVPGGNGIFNPIVVIDGRVVGTWKRVFKKQSVVMTFSPFTTFDQAHTSAIMACAERYAAFVGKTLVV